MTHVGNDPRGTWDTLGCGIMCATLCSCLLFCTVARCCFTLNTDLLVNSHFRWLGVGRRSGWFCVSNLVLVTHSIPQVAIAVANLWLPVNYMATSLSTAQTGPAVPAAAAAQVLLQHWSAKRSGCRVWDSSASMNTISREKCKLVLRVENVPYFPPVFCYCELPDRRLCSPYLPQRRGSTVASRIG